MARNSVQFQKGVSLNEFLSLYGSEEQCFDALKLHRHLGVSCNAAWCMRHKLMQVMRERDR